MRKSLESTLDNVTAGIVICDDNGTIQFANRALLVLLTQSQEQVSGKSIQSLIEPTQDSNDGKFSLAKLASEKKPLHTQLLCSNGARSPVDLTVAQQAEQEWLVTIKDVSRQEAAIASLKESQQINKTGTWSFDLLTSEVWWSPELFRIFKLPVTPTAPPYDTHKSLFTEDSWQKLEPAVTAAAEHGTPYELELELAERYGSKRVAIARCEPQTDEDGKVVKLIGTFQDISELASARAERDRFLDRLTLAKRAAGIGIWEWNHKTQELIWDEEMFRIYGKKGPVTNYQMWRGTVHLDDLQKAEDNLRKAILSNDVFKSSFRIIRHSEIRHIQAFAATSGDKVIGVNMDVTLEVALREEARRVNNLESLGVLAGGIAHDFNNQLSSISGRAELIELKANDAKFVGKMAKSLIESVDSAAHLTKQLLTFAKGSEPVRENTSVKELIESSVEFCLRGSAISVHYHIEEPLWHISVDPHQIEQVLQNIVINAMQAMANRGGKLDISAGHFNLDNSEAGVKAGKYVEIRLQDNGPGIPENVLPRIFDPYYTTKTQGHGLGLAICHSIISQHEGSLTASSKTAEGTCFRILLPATQEQVSAMEKATNVVQGEGFILVVDDMEDVLESTGSMLEALGYRYELASSVEQAMGKFAQFRDKDNGFDLVITDLTMPGSGGGIELLERLKDLETDIKVIVVSGYADNGVFTNAEQAGFAGKLQKPFRLSELSNLIKQVTS